jgi:DNA-binding PadR family transcriptional regulator
LGALSQSALSARELAEALGMRSKTGALKRTLGEMVAKGLIAYTLPDKPSSRLQKYRLTPAGEKALKERGGEDVK